MLEKASTNKKSPFHDEIMVEDYRHGETKPWHSQNLVNSWSDWIVLCPIQRGNSVLA